MKPPKYRLQTVLDVRDKAKQDAATHLAACRTKVAEAEGELLRRLQKVERCREDQERLRRRMLQVTLEGVQAHSLVQHRLYLEELKRVEADLRQAVEQQRAAIAKLEREVDAAIVKLVEASREVQAIEKHRDAWREKSRREAERREQKRNDEISTAAFVRKT
jgi:flagellar export protein FliJ